MHVYDLSFANSRYLSLSLVLSRCLSLSHILCLTLYTQPRLATNLVFVYMYIRTCAILKLPRRISSLSCTRTQIHTFVLSLSLACVLSTFLFLSFIPSLFLFLVCFFSLSLARSRTTPKNTHYTSNIQTHTYNTKHNTTHKCTDTCTHVQMICKTEIPWSCPSL